MEVHTRYSRSHGTHPCQTSCAIHRRRLWATVWRIGRTMTMRIGADARRAHTEYSVWTSSMCASTFGGNVNDAFIALEPYIDTEEEKTEYWFTFSWCSAVVVVVDVVSSALAKTIYKFQIVVYIGGLSVVDRHRMQSFVSFIDEWSASNANIDQFAISYLVIFFLSFCCCLVSSCFNSRKKNREKQKHPVRDEWWRSKRWTHSHQFDIDFRALWSTSSVNMNIGRRREGKTNICIGLPVE